MYAASTKQPENLSQSALSYLQSLDKATKALRQNQTTENKAPNLNSLQESSRAPTERRRSLSLMISELRQKTQKDYVFDESDDDKSTSGRRSHLSGKTPSFDSSSSTGEERILFDLPLDSGKEDPKKSDATSHGLPGLEVGRKSISELRELRTSIDHSLIKPPKVLKHHNTRERLSSTSRKESSDIPDFESESGEQLVVPRQNDFKTKSPFRAAVESGSDIESIDFDEDLPKPKSVRFKESSKSSGNSSITNRSIASKISVSKDADVDPSSGSSTLRDYDSDFDSVSTDKNVFDTDSNIGKPSKYRVNDATQTEQPQEPLFPEFCSSNVHHITKDVLRTHLRLLKEFNRLEWTSLQEWNAILDDIREKYDGPSTEKLKAVIEKRTRHYSTQ
nr:Protein F59B10.2 [Haemonchus contortus]